jgi:hypothetical protein
MQGFSVGFKGFEDINRASFEKHFHGWLGDEAQRLPKPTHLHFQRSSERCTLGIVLQTLSGVRRVCAMLAEDGAKRLHFL